jgi:membrane-associated phospholipid phosphatase
MTIRRLLIWGALFAVLAGLSVCTIDGVVAVLLQSSASQNRSFVNPIITAFEYLFAFHVSKFATGFLVVAASLVAFSIRRWRGMARLLLFVGVTHLATRLTAGVLKNVFLRVRPDDALATGQWQDHFFVDGGGAFPSGHAAHFWALFFASAVAFPRLRTPAVAVAICVSLARVAVNDHYVGDVLASISIAAFVAALCALLILPQSRWQQIDNAEEAITRNAVPIDSQAESDSTAV